MKREPELAKEPKLYPLVLLANGRIRPFGCIHFLPFQPFVCSTAIVIVHYFFIFHSTWLCSRKHNLQNLVLNKNETQPRIRVSRPSLVSNKCLFSLILSLIQHRSAGPSARAYKNGMEMNGPHCCCYIILCDVM